MITRQNILITGGLGFIGSRLAECLLRQNNEITIIDNLSPQIHRDDSVAKRLSRAGCNVLIGDIQDESLVSNSVRASQIIYHLAAETGTGQSMYQVEKYSSTNISGTQILLNSIHKYGTKLEELVLASSRSVYGEGKYACPEHGVCYPTTRNITAIKDGLFDPVCDVCGSDLEVAPTDEQSPRNPSSIYAATKSYQEDLFRIYNLMNQVNTRIFRFQNVYGPGQSLSNPYTGIISIFYNLIKTNKQINVFEDGLSSRDFIYIDDIVYFLSMKNTATELKLQTLNLGTGIQSTVLDVVKYLEQGICQEANYFVSGKFRTGDIRHNFADTYMLKSIYGDYKFVKLKDGVLKFIEWANESQIFSNNKYLESIEELEVKNLLS